MSLTTLLATLTLAATPAAGEVISLDQAIQQAQEKNLDLKQAREKLTQAKELSWKVLANYLPQVSAGGSYTRNQYEIDFSLPTGYWLRDMSGVPNPPWNKNDPLKGNGPDDGSAPGTASNIIMYPSAFETLTIQKQDTLGVQLKVNQALIVPALWPAFKIADVGEQVAVASVESARREILFAVVQLYYGCVGLKEVIGIQDRLLQNNLEHEKDARVRVEAGAMPKITLIRAQIDRSKAEQDLERAKMSYASAKVALGTLLDREEDFEVVHPAEPQVSTDTGALLSQAEKDRPDILVARLSRELADRSHDATWYKYAPNVFGSFTYQAANLKGFGDSYGSWALTLALSWTLWDGGLRESELRENASKLVEAEAALRSAEIKARDEVRRSMLDLQTARSNRIKADETVTLARENMQLVTVNYQAGAATQLEVSDANTALAAAELTVVSENLNAQLAALKLLKAAGAFNPQR